MPRRREVAERSIRPDSKFGSRLVAKFINCLMHDGKRSTSEGIVYEAFQIITEKTAYSHSRGVNGCRLTVLEPEGRVTALMSRKPTTGNRSQVSP